MTAPSGSASRAAVQRTEVLIIGAGMAGLSAVRELVRNGRNVIVLEARNRIGGRVATDYSFGFAAELGANWIHGDKGNPMTALARKAGVTAPAHDWEDFALVEAGKARSGDDQKLAKAMATLERKFERQFDTCLAGQAIAPHLDAMLENYAADSVERNFGRWLISSETSANYAADPNELSACAGHFGESFDGEDLLVTNGFGRIADTLAQGLDVRFGHVVSKIRETAQGMEVTTRSGVFHSDAVICTVPLGVLKASGIVFEPGLPDLHRQAIGRIGFGRFCKVLVKLASDPRMPALVTGFVPDSQRSFHSLVDMTRLAGKPFIVGYTGGSDASHAEAMTNQQVAQEIISSIRIATSSPPPEIEAIMVSRWSADPFARGAYSFPAVGTRQQDFAQLAEPISDRLVFAGEATAEHFATVHGALISGRRAAKQLN